MPTTHLSLKNHTLAFRYVLLLVEIIRTTIRIHHDRERKCARAILRLAQQFPGDPGAMSPLFLNYLLIAPGEVRI